MRARSGSELAKWLLVPKLKIDGGVGAIEGLYKTINAPEPVEAVVRAARAAGLEADGDRPPMSFSEDFAHFTAARPGCFLLMGNGEAGSHGQPLHASDYDFNDALLPLGAAFWAELVRDRLPVRSDR